MKNLISYYCLVDIYFKDIKANSLLVEWVGGWEMDAIYAPISFLKIECEHKTEVKCTLKERILWQEG